MTPQERAELESALRAGGYAGIRGSVNPLVFAQEQAPAVDLAALSPAPSPMRIVPRRIAPPAVIPLPPPPAPPPVDPLAQGQGIGDIVAQAQRDTPSAPPMQDPGGAIDLGAPSAMGPGASPALPGAPQALPAPVQAPPAQGGMQGYLGALGELQGVGQRQVEAARGLGEAAVGARQVEAETAGDLATEQASYQAGLDEAIDQGDDLVETARARQESELQAYRSAGLRDYWSDKSKGERVAAALFVGMGQLAAGLTGQGNAALRIVDDAIEREHRLQLEKLGKLKDQTLLAAAGVRDAETARLRLFEREKLRYSAARENVAARGAARLAQAGVPLEQARAQANVADSERKALEARLDAITAGMRAEAMMRAAAKAAKGRGGGAGGGRSGEYKSEVTGKPASDTERTSDAYAARMTTQLQRIKGLPPLSPKARDAIRTYIREEEIAKQNPGLDYVAHLFTARETLAQRLPPRDLETWEALKEFTAANLRRESGAAIGVDEERQALERFAPVVGDTESNRQAKLRAMEGVASAEGVRSYRPSYWKAQLDGGAAPVRASRGSAPSAPQAPARAQDPEAAAAAAWLRANPSHPKAAAVRARLQQMGAL